MRLTTETLIPFIGGQIEVQNEGEGYLYRGEIKTAAVEDDELRITLNWMAKGEGFPPIPKEWVADERLDYVASLQIYAVSVLSPSDEGQENRICLNSRIVGETAVLFPRNGSKLDPARVKGLRLPAAA